MTHPKLTAIIELQQLHLAYAHKVLLQPITTTINKGEFIGIFGPNGAGKTTLLKTLLGLNKPCSGTLKILGQAPKKGHPAIGYMPQHQQLNAAKHLSGYAFLAASIQGHRWGLPWLSQTNREQLELTLEQVGAQHYAHQALGSLSGGEQRRLLLAQALLGQPQLLLLDEPLANLDIRYQDTLIELIHTLQHRLQLTVLLTAHDINPLLKVMNRVWYMARGHATIGTPQQVLTSESLSALYETPVDVIRYQQRLFVVHQQSGQLDNVSHCE